MEEPSKTLVKAVAEVSGMLSSAYDHDSGKVGCNPKAHDCRADGCTCPDCGKFVCAWHSWVGDDGLQYCPKDAGNHRADNMPCGKH